MKTCPKCGQGSLPDNTKHCFACGYDFLSTGGTGGSKGNSSLIAVFVIIAIITLIVMVISNSTGPTPDPTRVPRPANTSTRPAPRLSTPTQKKISPSPTKKPTRVSTQVPSPTKKPTRVSTQVPSPPNSSVRYAEISGEVDEVNLRKSPGYLSKNDRTDVVAEIPAGYTVEILDGPEKADDLLWWYVKWNGYKGWIAEQTGRGRKILVFK